MQSVRLSSSIDNFVFNNPLLTHFWLQNVGFNNPLFDLTNLPNLEYVRVQSGHLTDNLIFGTHNNLEELRIFAGTYSSLNLSGMPALKYLTIADFIGTTIDISNNTLLEEFHLQYTDNFDTLIGTDASSSLEIVDFMQEDFADNPSNLDLAFNNQNLTDVEIRGANSVFISNNISDIGSIDLFFIDEFVDINNSSFNYMDTLLDASVRIVDVNSGQVSLTNIEGLSSLTFGDISTSLPMDLSTVETERITINSSSLSELNLKNGDILQQFNSGYDTDIQFICIDTDELNVVESGYVNSNYPVVIHPYCTFVLGGEYYEITGDILVDLGNGCSTYTNGPIFDLQFTVTDGSNTDTFYSNNTNSYSYTLPEGNHVLNSQLVNLDLWTVTPSSIDLNFPADANPYNQDFCITPAVTYNDAEIVIVPLNNGQPGFQADYKLIYKNKGTTTLSGSIDLTFNDDVMDFLTASPNVNTQTTGNLTWDNTDLLPFETREISFSMLLNTPTDPTFPLNGDDVLNYTATINPVDTDETPDSNTFALNQTVVNSFDPNDVKCLQGNTITPEQVGEYVHYRIRFENTGTANAINVVVKDVLDTTKFDISTLVPLHGSHNFYTRIENGNEVEFIFENIQLPFDDANNDGYVLFKIKTLPSLVLGDSFNNQAEIYFDFNFPIITNNETTLIEENLSVTEHSFNRISIFPNPTRSTLNIKSITNISSISIYDLNGKLLQTEQPRPNSFEYPIDVKNLSNGIYFLEVISDNTKQILKFIKS